MLVGICISRFGTIRKLQLMKMKSKNMCSYSNWHWLGHCRFSSTTGGSECSILHGLVNIPNVSVVDYRSIYFSTWTKHSIVHESFLISVSVYYVWWLYTLRTVQLLNLEWFTLQSSKINWFEVVNESQWCKWRCQEYLSVLSHSVL